MADSGKRIRMSKDAEFQNKCCWYMYQKAAAIFAQETPDTDDLLLAKALWAGQVDIEDMARIVLTNATIGAAVDAGNAVQEDWVEYAVTSDETDAKSFHNLAVSYRAAGLIGA